MFKIGLIKAPTFYISAFFERNRAEYYERLLTISSGYEWTGWIEFFLKAVIEQAHNNQMKAAEILELYENKKNQVVKITHSQYSIHALDYIISHPVFKSSDFTAIEEIPTPAAKRILAVFRDKGLLRTVREASGRRPAIYAFSELINTTEGQKIF